MKSIRPGILAAALIGISAWQLPACAADAPRHVNTSERAEAKQAQALLDKAVARFKEKGDAALAEFSNRGGEFVDGEFYIFVVSTAGKMLASGGSSAMLIGQDVTHLRDAAGKPFMRDLIEAARKQGAGMVEYRWLNKVDGKVEPKTTLFRKVDDKIVAAGYYLPRSSPEEARGMLEQAVAALKKDGDAAFAQFNDPKGRFVVDDLYVFAVGLDDAKFYAHGATPSLVGKESSELRDAQGKPIIQQMINLAKVKGAGEIGYVWRNPVTNKVETKHSVVQKVDKYLVAVGYYTK